MSDGGLRSFFSRARKGLLMGWWGPGEVGGWEKETGCE